MNLTPQQLETQEALLLRLYPGKSLEEAKSEELHFGCLLMPKYLSRRTKRAKLLAHFGGGSYRVMERIDTSLDEEEYAKDFGHCEFRDYEAGSYEIIGLPPTLPRVLEALGKDYLYDDLCIMQKDYCSSSQERLERCNRVCFWDLRNDDGTDATLWDQDIQTQDAISDLLGIKER